MGELTAYDKFMQQALKYGWLNRGPSKTGQTTKYRTGDDGDLEKGTPKTPPRFTDNGDGTITDNATGLMWAKDKDGGGCANGGKKDWPDAIDWANSLDFAGHSDWRLPNFKELLSIVDYSVYNPSIDTTYFTSLPDEYWSSTTAASLTTHAWIVDFLYGMVSAYIKSTDIFYVRAVRGGL